METLPVGKNRDLVVGTLQDFGRQENVGQFFRVTQGIQQEPSMLDTSPTMLLRKYNDGRLAVALLRNESYISGEGHVYVADPETKAPEVVGTGGFSTLFDREIFAQCFPQMAEDPRVAQIPTVLELGTIYLRPDLRQRGFSKGLHLALLQENAEKIANGEMLVVATSVTIPEIATLLGTHLAPFGILPYDRDEVPFIARLTCTCGSKPGTGFGISNECGHRIRSEVPLQDRLRLETLDDFRKIDDPDHSDCIVFVSSGDKVRNFELLMDSLVKDSFTSRQRRLTVPTSTVFQMHLREIGHYA